MTRGNLYPERSNKQWDIWVCSGCGAPTLYAKQSGQHAGPLWRALDRRYSKAPCYRVANIPHRNLDQLPHRPGEVMIFRHDSRPQSSQPAQASSLLNLPSSFKDPSRTYGTFPGHNRRGPSNLVGARSVVVPTVEPRGGTVRIEAVVSTEPDPSS